MKQTITAMLTSLTLIAVHTACAQPGEALRAYQAQLAAAEKSLRLNETRELRRWLDACDPALRGWEWDHLDARRDTSVRRVEMPETPIRIEMSPAGDRLAVVEGSSVRLLNWPQLDEIRRIDDHTDAVYRASFSADGERLVTVSRDVTSRSWDLESGSELARIELANPAFAAATLDPTGTIAATCAWERDETGAVHGLVWIWDAESGAIRARKRVGIKPLSALRFTPDGTRLIVGSWDGLVHVLDTRGDEVSRLTLPDQGVYNAVNDLAVSPDGRLVAAGSKDRTTQVFDIATGELITTLRGHGGYVEGVSFSPDGLLLATSSLDSTVALWDTRDWQRRAVLRGPAETVRGVAWSADSRFIVAAALDGQLWVWNAKTNDAAATDIHTGQQGIYSTSLSPDGTLVAVACFDGFLRLFDSRTGTLVREWNAHPGSTCHAAMFSADGRRLITSSWDKTARVWDPADGSELATLDAGDGVYATAISPDGQWAATSGSTLQIWRVDGAARLHEVAVEGAQPTRVEFSSDGRLLASGWTDGIARVHDGESGSLIAALGTAGNRVESVAFLPGDKRLASGDSAGVVKVHSVRGGEPLYTIDTGGRGVNHIACSGTRIAVATDQLWLIDSERGEIVLGLTPQADTIWHLSWSADGDRLATCAIPGLIRILER